MSTTFDHLRAVTEIVADTGDIETIKRLKPTDATTNPSLILQASQKPEYRALIDEAIEYAKKVGGKDNKKIMSVFFDRVSVNFGKEILKSIPGYVSTEVDARLSFDTEKTIEKARSIIKMYEDEGVKRDRILIKIASTWEGMKACQVLEAEGIHCNMTLLFTFCQAVAAAQSHATLVSPFVGRIRDWYMKHEGRKEAYEVLEDPGVKSVRNIYSYYKKFNIPTIVMGASFRSAKEVLGLAGCDKLTISPSYLDEMMKENSKELPFKPLTAKSVNYEGEQVSVTESEFRWMLNEDQMATELLSDGIRRFAKDTEKVEDMLREKL